MSAECAQQLDPGGPTGPANTGLRPVAQALLCHGNANDTVKVCPVNARRSSCIRFALALLVAGASSAFAETVIPLNARSDFATYYLTVDVGAGMVDEYLVDTGAGYMTITESTLAGLEAAGGALQVREIKGHLADGRVLTVPVYLLEEITIGRSCVLRNVEAAVLPGASRGLLGLSVLRRTSPFEFSVDPPTLRLSNCFQQPMLTASTDGAD